jgi:dihydrolipoamide dehydrogenase
MKVACVEGRGALGGTCLNVGCIPSKALLHASHLYAEANGHFAEMGIVADPSIDMDKMQSYRAGQVDQLTGGVAFLFKKNKVDWIDGWGRIDGPGKVSVKTPVDSDKVLTAKNIVIATGSEPASLPGVEVDEERVVTSTGGLTLKAVPKKMVVIGAGVIGLELGSVWRRLGAEVQVIEFLDQITPGMDLEVCKTFQKILTKQGLQFTLGAAVQSVEKGSRLTVRYKNRKDESEGSVEADVVLLATGRKPYTAGLGLEEAGVKMTDRGVVETDAGWRTNVEGIYAIGDVITGPMLAHKAEDEGVAVAESIAGQHGHVNYGVIPSVIYTDPEVASVGQTEEELKAEGRAYKVGKFPFMANGRAKAHFATDGFAKVLADKETDRILGVHVIGPSAGELIHEYCVAMEFGAAAEDIARTCHAHPTLSEAMREAAMACGDGAIHM